MISQVRETWTDHAYVNLIPLPLLHISVAMPRKCPLLTRIGGSSPFLSFTPLPKDGVASFGLAKERLRILPYVLCAAVIEYSLATLVGCRNASVKAASPLPELGRRKAHRHVVTALTLLHCGMSDFRPMSQVPFILGKYSFEFSFFCVCVSQTPPQRM